jgi:large subunit ribosomal protein L4
MLVDLYTKDGNVNGQVELEDKIFGIEPKEHAMHLAVTTYLHNQRQGTRKTKTRSEVSGGGRKPWSQKGRGTARAGSSRSPVWVGGGTIHGPQPKTYSRKLPKKIRDAAKFSALSARASEKNIIVVEDFTFDNIKTKNMAEVLKKLNIYGEKTLVMMTENDNNLHISGRNLAKVDMDVFDRVSTYDILNHKKIVLFKGAVEKINNSLTK